MLEGDKKSSLERLKKSLYSRRDSFGESPRHSIHGSQTVVPESWETEASKEEALGVPAVDEKINRGIRKAYKVVFWVSFFFFLAAVGFGVYTFFGGKNFVSVDNIDILIEGPVSIAGGEPLALNVSVVNKNATEMQLVDLIAKYPQGTKDSADPTKDLSQVRVSLGTIRSQSMAQKSFSSLLFGEEGVVRDIVFTAEYRTEGSSAIFYKEKTYHITISSSPVLISIDALDKVLSNQPTDVTVTISSNTTAPVKNLLLSLDYPFGFTVASANPSATYGNNIWRIGDLAPGTKRTINLKIAAQGQDGEERTIQADLGIQSTSNEREIATTIISGDHTFVIERPFLGIDLALEGNSSSDLVLTAGRAVHADIIWKNNSAGKITNARIVAKLSGNTLDRNSITTSGGYYDSSINSIIWEAGRVDSLGSIAPGDSGRQSFSFSTLSATPGQSVSNPIVTVSVTASGSRTDESGSPQNITTAAERSVRIVSNLALSARALRSQGPIVNTGPIPPKVEQQTTYTVVWIVTNTSNTVTGAQVSATLPPYVTWTGVVSPADAAITYNPTGGVITWSVGDVAKNADIGTGAKQVAFQISLKPSVTQVGRVPDIISQAVITGTDSFAGVTIQNNAPSLSTQTTTDILFKSGDEIVTQ